MSLRVLAIGSSETNRRRVSSLDAAHHEAWGAELCRRYAVYGYWPAWFMHALEAQVAGRPEVLDRPSERFRGDYLYDRARRYDWMGATLWNTAIPGTNARAGLFYVQQHLDALRDFAPDIIVLCLGSTDCIEFTVNWKGMDLGDIGPLTGLDPDARLCFPPCEDVTTLTKTLADVADAVESIRTPATKVIQLEVIPAPLQSRALHARTLAFASVVRGLADRFEHQIVGYPYLGTWTSSVLQQWLMDDNHPNDAMNARIGAAVLDALRRES